MRYVPLVTDPFERTILFRELLLKLGRRHTQRINRPGNPNLAETWFEGELH